MSINYRQLQKRKAPLPPLSSEAPYISYWVHPVNQPRNRAKLKIIEISGGEIGNTNIPPLSYWIHPTNQPQLRRKARVIEILGGAAAAVVEAPYVSYWVQDVNQPLRSRIRSRQQPPTEWIPPVFNQNTTTPANDAAMWMHNTYEPRIVKNRQQPRYQGQFYPPINSEAPYVSYWVHPANQPLKNRIRKPLQFEEVQPPFPPEASEAPYVSYWKQPTNEPLRQRWVKRQQPPEEYVAPQLNSGFLRLTQQPLNNRKSKRQQPQNYGQFWAIDIDRVLPPLAAWIQPVQQPLKNRKSKRLQPQSNYANPIYIGQIIIPTVTSWIHPTSQPYRRKSKEIDISGGGVSSVTTAPFTNYFFKPANQPRITKRRQQPQYYGQFWADNQPVNNILSSQWYKPTNEPLSNRKPKRQQPRYSTQFMPALPSQAPYLSYWKQPTTQPRITKKRQQPVVIDVFWADNAPVNAILVSQWDKQQPQPLRNRVTKRQQPRYLGQFMPPLPSQAPYISYWRPPLSQPLRRPARRYQPNRTAAFYTAPDGLQTAPLESWQRPTNQPARKGNKRQQPRQQLAPQQPVKSWMHTTEQPRRKQRRLQPITNWNPWYETTANTNLVSQWKRSRDQQFFVSKKRRQQPRIGALNWANIYPHLSTPLESWKQPINQPVRARRPTVRYVFKQAYVNLASLAITHTLPIFIDEKPSTIYLDEQPSVIELEQNDDVISIDSSPSTIEIEQNSNELVLR